jgi:hypothetical protein
MPKIFEIAVDEKCYDAIATPLACLGRAVLIGLYSDGEEVGSVKLVSRLPAAALTLGHLDEEQILDRVCVQFTRRDLARLALASDERSIEVNLE